MNLTKALLELVIKALRDKAGFHDDGTEESETLEDAADALADAVDMLTESGDL